MQWLGESCTDGVQVLQSIRKDLKKGQNTCGPVQIHSNGTSVGIINERHTGPIMMKAPIKRPAPRLLILSQTKFT